MFEDGGGGLSSGPGIFWGFSYSAHSWEATAFTAEQHLPSYPMTVTMIFYCVYKFKRRGGGGDKVYYGRCANGQFVIDYLHNEWKLLEDFKSYIFNTVSFLSDLNNTTSCSQAKSWTISSTSQKGKHKRISPTIHQSSNLLCFRCTNNCTMSLGVVLKKKQKIYPWK